MKKPEPLRITTLLAVIGKEANKVYEAFSWGSLDRTKIASFAEVRRILRAKTQCDLWQIPVQ